MEQLTDQINLRSEKPSGPVHGTAMVINNTEERTNHEEERDFTSVS